MKKIILIILLFTYYSCGFSQQTSTFTDSRDGKTYKTVKIGNQVWMAENLAFKTDSGCWVYNDSLRNVTKYGYLYNWEIAKSVCPNGWHLPSIEEFEILIKNSNGSANAAYRSLIPGGSSGFSALFGGWRGNNGSFGFNGKNAGFWSSSQSDDEYAWYLLVISLSARAVMLNDYRSYSFSVRCLKDD